MSENHPKARSVKLPRLYDFAILAIAFSVLILLFQPSLLPVTAYKLSLVTLAAWLAYRIDRSLFPYARPHCKPDGDLCDSNIALVTTLWMIRRAIIVAAVILAIALGA